MLTSGMSLQVAAYSYTKLYYNFDSIKLQQINISAFILCFVPLHYIAFLTIKITIYSKNIILSCLVSLHNKIQLLWPFLFSYMLLTFSTHATDILLSELKFKLVELDLTFEIIEKSNRKL